MWITKTWSCHFRSLSLIWKVPRWIPRHSLTWLWKTMKPLEKTSMCASTSVLLYGPVWILISHNIVSMVKEKAFLYIPADKGMQVVFYVCWVGVVGFTAIISHMLISVCKYDWSWNHCSLNDKPKEVLYVCESSVNF